MYKIDRDRLDNILFDIVAFMVIFALIGLVEGWGKACGF